MQAIFEELPLALFTTLAPMGAGAFIVLAIVLARCTFSEQQLRAIDKMTVIPLVVAAVGFVCAFFHLQSPLNAMYALAGLGSSPLTNEVLVGVAFMLIACIYLVLALAGKIGAARLPLAIASAVMALVFAVFMALAYTMSTVASWNSPFTFASLLGIVVTGGAAVGLCSLALAKAASSEQLAPARSALLALVTFGTVLAVVGIGGQLASVAASGNALVSGGELAAELAPLSIAGIVLIVAAAVMLAADLLKGVKAGPCIGACVIVAAGILLARLSFYGLYLSVGLTVM